MWDGPEAADCLTLCQIQFSSRRPSTFLNTSTQITMADVSLIVTSPITSSERRITPSWTITTLRQKLEHVTGIPPSAQTLSLVRPGSFDPEHLVSDNEDVTTVGQFGITKDCEIRVCWLQLECGSRANICFRLPTTGRPPCSKA